MVFNNTKNNKRPKRSPLLMGLLALLFLFQILALSLVFLYGLKEIDESFIYFSLGLILVSFLSVVIIGRVSFSEPYLLLIANMIFSIGIVMIYRMRANLGQRQLILYFAGLLMFFISYFFLKKTGNFWEGKTVFFYVLTLLTFIVTLVLGHDYQGARNWISFFGVNIQLSEFAKIPFVFFIASWYKNYEKYSKNLLGRFSLSIGVYILMALFLLQRELGTAMIFFTVMLGCQLAFEDNYYLVILNIVLAGIGLYLAYHLFGHVKVRFDMWLNPWQDINEKGYQIVQALFAIAEGGMFGRGLGLGQPNRVPLGHSDFIFASIIEEMGVFMGICLIFLFVILIYRGFKIAMKQERDFYSSLALAVTIIFASQSFIMFAGVIKLIPLTGITIPFLTYGGSSLISSFILLAILQICSENRRESLHV